MEGLVTACRVAIIGQERVRLIIRERKLTYLRQLWSKDEQECGKVDAEVDGFIMGVMGGQ